MNVVSSRYILLMLWCLNIQALNYNEISAYPISEIKRILTQAGEASSFDYVVGSKFYNGAGIEVNTDAAFNQWIKAIKNGDERPFVPLGYLIIMGKKFPEELLQDLSWLTKKVDQQNIEAWWLLRVLVLSPFIDIRIRVKIANYLQRKDDFYTELTRLVRHKNRIALHMQSYIEPLGQENNNNDILMLLYLARGSEDDLKKAENYASLDPNLSYDLGTDYRYGFGVPKNLQKAYQFLLKAAEHHLPSAEAAVGALLLDGLGVEKNLDESEKWLKMATEKDFKPAVSLLSLVAEERFLQNDYESACELYKYTLSKTPFPREEKVRFDLAQAYSLGLCQGSVADADALYQSVLASESEDSNYWKAIMYEYGLGVSKDLIKAREYYEKFKKAPSASSKEVEKVLKKRLEDLEKKIKRAAQKTQQDAKKETSAEKRRKKKIGKKQVQAEGSREQQEEPLSEEESLVEAAKELDIVGYHLKNEFNNALAYPDKSLITDIDTHDNRVKIHNNYDNSDIVLEIDKKKIITPDVLRKLKKYTYDKRVQDWFNTDEKTLLKNYTKEQIERHRFAQRVDEMIQLYGHKGIFVKNDGSFTKAKVLPGHIETADHQILKGFFEYSYYKDSHNQPVLYHRFLHPRSRVQIV